MWHELEAAQHKHNSYRNAKVKVILVDFYAAFFISPFP